MAQLVRKTIALLGATGLAACATIPAPSPVEITRFHNAAAVVAPQSGTVFVSDAPGQEDKSLELAPYKAAVARELVKLGFAESSAGEASYVAQVSADSFRIGDDGGRRDGPVSVGVGGSTGSYGSGVGLGIGINLGGGSKERVGHQMRVMIRDAETNQTVWEGRAEFTASPKSETSSAENSSAVLAEALFGDYPGNNGETVKVKAPE